MNKRITTWLFALLTVLPIVFVLIFFGFLPLRFDVVIYTNNIVGEGTSSSYLTDSNTSFSYLYKGNSYFGSELKTLRLYSLPYNVESVGLYMYDVDEADFISYDISLFGRTVTHLNIDGITHPFSKTTKTAVISEELPIVHLEKKENEDSLYISFPGSTLIPKYIWIAYVCLIILVSTAFAFAVSTVMRRWPAVNMPLFSAATIMATMVTGCFVCGSLPYVNYTYFLLNWLILYAVALLLNSLTLPWVGTASVSVFTFVWYVANYFVILFRSKPIMPADLKALGTAKEVAGGYDLTPTWQIIVGGLVVILFLTVLVLAWKKTKTLEKKSLQGQLTRRGFGVAVSVVMVIFGFNNSAFSHLNTFQWDAKVLEGFHREGIVLTFAKSAISAHVEKPDGYTREVVNAFLNEYQNKTSIEGIQPTRIIVVMNEAFSDLRTVGLDESIDVMPFIDSLDNNTIEGNLYVSVIGGGTCNTEFEALTGNTMAFLPTGAYPYTENVTEPLFSLASYFSNISYDTEAFHASTATSWNRSTVYPNLGFGVFNSIANYPEITSDSYLHSHIKDAIDYAFLEQRDSEKGDQPRFLFNVTIQNHADYDHFEDVEEAATLVRYEGSLHQNVRVYLSLLKVSDDSINDLVTHYKDSHEPTMIVFFGDHQPMLPAAAQNDVYTQMQYYLDFFKSKFFIWTNYETETVHDAAISANYLPWLILERGNFPLPPYVQMLKEVHEKYPIISSQGVMDAEGNVYDNVAVLADDPLIQKYQYIQYANLFDEIDPAWFEVK